MLMFGLKLFMRYVANEKKYKIALPVTWTDFYSACLPEEKKNILRRARTMCPTKQIDRD